MGATGTELDVRRTADDQVVVHHDADLADGRLIIDLAAADLPPEVPLLADVLALHGPAVVNVEIKSDSDDKDFDPAYPVVDLVLAVLADDPAHAASARIVTSFDDDAIDAVRARAGTGPDAVPTGLITMNPLVGSSFAQLRETGHHAVMVHHRVITAAMIDQAANHDVFVGAWTVNSERTMARMQRLGVDAIMTDTPDRAVELYRRS